MIDRSPHFLLNSIAGWRAASLDHASVVDGCLELQLAPGSPLPLADATGTFGGLQNPSAIALDSQCRVYVLDSAACSLLRYDRCLQQFLQLPCVGPCGCRARELDHPARPRHLPAQTTSTSQIQAIAAYKSSPLRVLRYVVSGVLFRSQSLPPESRSGPHTLFPLPHPAAHVIVRLPIRLVPGNRGISQ